MKYSIVDPRRKMLEARIIHGKIKDIIKDFLNEFAIHNIDAQCLFSVGVTGNTNMEVILNHKLTHTFEENLKT